MEEVSVVVGGSQNSGLTPYQIVALVITALLTVVNILITTVLARKNRRRSVDDEFWFRKVVAPAVIDKVLIFASRWSEEISRSDAYRGKGDATKDTVESCKKEVRDLITGCLCLKLYGASHYVVASNRLDGIVDSVTECVYAVSSDAISEAEAQRIVDSKRLEIGNLTLAMLADLKKLQSSF